MTGTVLVTGASSGIGRACAIALARAGHTTIATVRDPARAGDLREHAAKAGVDLDIRTLDLTGEASIAACVSGVTETHGGLDAVVNSAGTAGTRSTAELGSLAALRADMEVNFFGVAALASAVMPALRASRGRFVHIGSVRGVIGQPFNESYSAGKFASEGYLEALAPVAAAVGVRVSIVEPAAVLDTNFITNSPDDPPALHDPDGPYAAAFAAYRRWVSTQAADGGQVASDVAEVVVATLTADRPAFRVPTSDFAARYLAAKLADPDGSAIQALTRSWVGATDT